MSADLARLRNAIAALLVEVEDLLPDAYRLTLIARHVSNDNAHILLSVDDELEAAIAAIQRLRTEAAVTIPRRT